VSVKLAIKESAVTHIKKIVPKDYAGVRISLVPNGCAGWEHKFSLCEQPMFGDYIVPLGDDINIVMNQSTKAFIEGASIQYIKNGLNMELTIDNPNVTVCGCGKSFSQK